MVKDIELTDKPVEYWLVSRQTNSTAVNCSRKPLRAQKCKTGKLKEKNNHLE